MPVIKYLNEAQEWYQNGKEHKENDKPNNYGTIYF